MSVSEGRVPPYDAKAEAACLGAILLNNDALPIVRNLLAGPEDFYVESNRRIFSAMIRISQSSMPVDHVTLGNELAKASDLEKIGGAVALAALTDSVASIANVDHYARIVSDKASVRRMIYAAQEIVSVGYADKTAVGDYLSAARKSVTVASARDVGEGPVMIGEGMNEVIAEIESGELPENLVRTGIDMIDELTGGLWPGLLTVLGARPAMGKSALCLNIATNAALQKRSTLYIPTEDTRRYALLRELARFGDIDLNDLMLRSIHRDDWPKLIEGANQVMNLPLWVDDSPGLSSERIAQAAALHKQMHGLDLLVVDHLGEMTDKGESKTAATEAAAMGLRDIAKELDIPVLLATQLNRDVEFRKDKRPTMHDLRQSGAIEQIARVVWFLYRRGYYQQGCEDDPDTQLIVAKATHGKTGTIKLWADLSRMYMRGWNLDIDGPFPDENSGRYVAPEHGGVGYNDEPRRQRKSEQKQPQQKGFFDNTGPQSAAAKQGHWTDDY